MSPFYAYSGSTLQFRLGCVRPTPFDSALLARCLRFTSGSDSVPRIGSPHAGCVFACNDVSIRVSRPRLRAVYVSAGIGRLLLLRQPVTPSLCRIDVRLAL